MTDNELLLAISEMFDSKLKPIEHRITKIEVAIESEIKPNIQLLAENYVPASKKYTAETEKIESIETDVSILKAVVTEHSEKLQQLA